MRVLLSIKPCHVENIISGTKLFEFRRRIFSRRDVSTVLIYATKPVARFVGEFDIANILEDEPDSLWSTTHRASGISKAFYDAYFSGVSKAYAIQIGALRIFDCPVTPHDVIENFTPPQSYMYVGGTGRDIRRSPQPLLI
jgi:predicted transcriptional regulator